MLLVAQLPFTDSRPFLDSETGRLPLPSWPLPRVNVDYVRSFGPVRQRRKGGSEDWPGEEVFCNAVSAVRFPPKALRIQLSHGNGQLLYPYCAFRRFLVDGRFAGDGSVVSRLEIGIGVRRKKPRDLNLPVASAWTLLQSLLKTEIVLTNATETPQKPLLNSSTHFAKLYLKGSTHRNTQTISAFEQWWVTPGTPTVILEYRPEDLAELPDHTRQVATLNTPGIQLNHCRFETDGLRLGVWFLCIHRREADADTLRRLRLNLLRLHAERESLKNVLRMLAQKRLGVERGKPSSERLQMYLDESARLLSREQRDSLPQSDILKAAQDFEDFVTLGERETLLSQLSSIRKTLLRRIEAITTRSDEREGAIYQIFGDNVTINHEQNGSKTVNNQKINFGSGNVFQGDVNVTAARTIQDSFNRVASSNANPELRNALQDLHKGVAEMSKGLPPDRQIQVSKDLETLSSEAISQSPRRKWYELSAEGLLEAAKAVGEIATPVVTAVKTVLGLLGV